MLWRLDRLDDVARLFAALRAYGPNTLLYVRPEREGRPAGTVECLGGHPPDALWLQLCLRPIRPRPAMRRIRNC